MNKKENNTNQKEARSKYLRLILDSTAEKKLIIAGPGTGKTYTFLELLKLKEGGPNLAMTFIRKLTNDMETRLAPYAEVKTFHAYCKKILHEKNGKVDLVPYFTQVVKKDAELLGLSLQGFDSKIQRLEEVSDEIKFLLKRGDYYSVVGFNDSVFRLYKALQSDPHIVPEFQQILVDEYQDFNELEVAFIGELGKRGSILIVGDDDQAIYKGREASPKHLRALLASGEYEVFHLPFCGRCTQIIVEATNVILQQAEKEGYLKGRVKKPYECYIEDKGPDSNRYPKLIYAKCTTAKVLPKYIISEIRKISTEDIVESRKEGDEYPTALVVGERQYLKEVFEQLQGIYPQVSYSPSKELAYGMAEGYEQLMGDEDSNLGWRILMEQYLEDDAQREILGKSEMGRAIVELLDDQFVQKHKALLEPLHLLGKGEAISTGQEELLKNTLGTDYEEVVKHFKKVEETVPSLLDCNEPTILLTSFQGCKGLSAGHVFILGAHEGSRPKINKNIEDVEISEFVVALTRTRKQCHIIYNQWLFSPKSKSGSWLPKFEESKLVSWIPSSMIEAKGVLKASDF